MIRSDFILQIKNFAERDISYKCKKCGKWTGIFHEAVVYNVPSMSLMTWIHDYDKCMHCDNPNILPLRNVYKYRKSRIHGGK